MRTHASSAYGWLQQWRKEVLNINLINLFPLSLWQLDTVPVEGRGLAKCRFRNTYHKNCGSLPSRCRQSAAGPLTADSRHRAGLLLWRSTGWWRTPFRFNHFLHKNCDPGLDLRQPLLNEWMCPVTLRSLHSTAEKYHSGKKKRKGKPNPWQFPQWRCVFIECEQSRCIVWVLFVENWLPGALCCWMTLFTLLSLQQMMGEMLQPLSSKLIALSLDETTTQRWVCLSEEKKRNNFCWTISLIYRDALLIAGIAFTATMHRYISHSNGNVLNKSVVFVCGSLLSERVFECSVLTENAKHQKM